jgi:hypothetical protein
MHHHRDLVASLAFFDVGAEVEVIVAIVDVEGWLHVVLGEFYGVRALAVERVFEVAASLDFPAAVDVATGEQRER